MCAPDTSSRAARRQRGLSIIEVMVGMVVALLVGLAATGSAAMFTASQRQGIGAGGAMVNASTALTAIRDDAAAAGLGFFGDNKYLCEKLNLSVNTTLVRDGAAFTPIQVTNEATGADRIDAVYATQVASGANVLLNASTTGASADLRSLLPVIVTSTSQPAVLLAPKDPGEPCLVRSVTAVTASTTDTPQTLTFANTGTYNKVGFTTTVTYPDKGRIALLGDLRWARYRLQGTDLRLERPLGGDPVVLAKNVMAFRVQYGLANAAAGSTALETWQNPSGTFAAMTPANLPRVRALRIGLVTRSPQAEKPDASGTCQASTALPKDPLDPNVNVTPDVTNWQCYRYRTAVVVVPLRNLVMGMTP
jgi:type IV pilus assembly protein PilW